MISSFYELDVYKRAYRSSLEIHQISLKFPSYETHELGTQIRRATKSIAMNIAEGYGRQSSKEDFKRFLIMAKGSCDEVRVQLDYCKDLGYIHEGIYERLKEEYIIIGKQLSTMIKEWK